MKKAILCCVAGVVAVGMGLYFSGCESAGTTALTVTPSYVDLTASGSNTMTQTFTVTDGLGELSLPLQWKVSNPFLGYIAGHGGASASYVRTDSSGDNAITVRDQYGAEGVATVHQ